MVQIIIFRYVFRPILNRPVPTRVQGLLPRNDNNIRGSLEIGCSLAQIVRSTKAILEKNAEFSAISHTVFDRS